jgi:hypothetical protein
MSRFSRRNSTSALSYLGDKFVPIEVVLAVLPATSSTCFVSTVGLKVGRGGGYFLLGCRHLRGVRGGMDFFELRAKEHCFRKGGFSVLALLSLPETAINHDDTIWSWHFQLVVDVARPSVKAVEGRAAEDHMVCTLERDHLEGYGLFAVIIFIAEGDLGGDGPEGLCLVTRG